MQEIPPPFYGTLEWKRDANRRLRQCDIGDLIPTEIEGWKAAYQVIGIKDDLVLLKFWGWSIDSPP